MQEVLYAAAYVCGEFAQYVFNNLPRSQTWAGVRCGTACDTQYGDPVDAYCPKLVGGVGFQIAYI